MTFTRQNTFAALRIIFGFIWAVDAAFKWTPTFLNGLPDLLASTAVGQPAIIAGWIHIWVAIVSVSPHSFAVLVALIETALALCLIFDLFPRTALISGFFFSILLWGVGEAFGAPYGAGSTDIGTAIVYALVFAALYLERFGANSLYMAAVASRGAHGTGGTNLQRALTMRTHVIKGLSVVIVILIAILVAPYISIHNATQPSMDMAGDETPMSPNMMQKTFPLDSATSSIPTVDFTLTKDAAADGWDLHILTTNFTFTPENINTAPIADQGHVHLYIDGKLIVVFGAWYHIDAALLPPGAHTIVVSLNANDHSAFSLKNKPIQISRMITTSPF